MKIIGIIVEFMEKLLGKKVYVENYANVTIRGEFLAGSGKRQRL